MGNLTITNKVLERYFNFLLRFDNNTKKKLIVKLTNSLEFNNEKKTDIATLFGAWKDDKSTDEIIAEIRKSRVAPKDKDLL